MANVPKNDMAAKLLAESFQRIEPPAEATSDPIADTLIVVTLDQLRPYDHDPRVTRNPRYDDIKASIGERGLDAPPAITRRPGESHYIIRNGGNTRLAILRELWSETKDKRFFQVPCLFRPWSERGEIVALTGHLAENELHGGLTFIERALGIAKARELYEAETGKPLSQSELARRLAMDGYPVPQPHISRMQDAVRYLLPAIPATLYGGLGRPQIERLTGLRKTALRTWEKRASGRHLSIDFPSLFQDVLSMFNTAGDAFSVKRVQDELVGQMADMLGTDYDTLTLDLDEGESWQRALDSDPKTLPSIPATPLLVTKADSPPMPETSQEPSIQRTGGTDAGADIMAPTHSAPLARSAAPVPASALPDTDSTPPLNAANGSDADERVLGHIVSPASSTDRLQSIKRLVAEHTGDSSPDFSGAALQSIPVQVDGLYPISDIWFIDASLDAPRPLRIHIAQLAQEIAEESDLAGRIEATESGIGYQCNGTLPQSFFARTLFALLTTFSAPYQDGVQTPLLDGDKFGKDLAALLQGGNRADEDVSRLSDAGLVKLFRLIRLARRLLELDPSGTSAMRGFLDQ